MATYRHKAGAPRRHLRLLVRDDLINLAHEGDMNISKEVEEFLTHRLGVNSPSDKIQAEINLTETKLASLKTSLTEAQAKRPTRELEYWKEQYTKLGKDEKMYPGRRERWIVRVAKMLKMDPKELKEVLEAKE